ncbi:Fanconi anemia group F protein isoform X1 [Cynoglossus semilaevis]|uniref:FA complementation group F n=1 Tax=Cynoglossus semilaevis TaxID=244447 RepID=A0A3P8V6K7_CYNSE|nr:Fanconi anemia group F protein isoform X1 [Cynoglossus semilaevis]
MESVLKNVSSSVELLAVAAHSSVVEHWQEQTVSRAFQWASYCEHLHSRFHSNPTVRGTIEKQIQQTNQHLLSAFPGCTQVCFSDLSRLRHLLLQGLLTNPKLPLSIMKTLFDSKHPAERTYSENQDVHGLCNYIVRCKSACKVLRLLTDSLAVGAVGADAEVLGETLMERLEAVMSQSGDLCKAEHFLDSVLQGGEGATPHLCVVISAALLTRKKSAAETASHAVLLDWLLKRHSTLKHMVTEAPTALITDLVKRHLKFRDAYCNVLKEWASDMEYSLSEGEWTTQTNPTLTFQNLTQHFLTLFEACPSVRAEVEKELNILKKSDGDFEVGGLSVWGDLLSALNQ